MPEAARPTRIGAYEVRSELGRGGAGVVYRGVGPDGREVAVKVIRGARDTNALARFERERRLLASLSGQPGILPLLDAGESEAGPYFVMPFLAGGTLRAQLDAAGLQGGGRRGLGIPQSVAVVAAAARAVGAAHRAGVVHRDLKPENILFTAEGAPCVSDLGLAKHFRGDAPGASQTVAITHSGVITGTASYMAPEQLLDARAAGPPADVFALGLVLYECLSGQPALTGSSLVEVLRRVERVDIEPLAAVRPGLPRWLLAVVERALAPEPSARFADGAALASALEPAAAPRRPTRCLGPLAAAAAVILTVALLVSPLVSRTTPPPAGPPPSTTPLSTMSTSTSAPTPTTTWSAEYAQVALGTRLRLEAVIGDPAWSHAATVRHLAFLPGGRLASSDEDGVVRVWDADGAPTATAHLGAPVSALAASPDGTALLVAGADGRLALLDPGAGTARAERPADGGPVQALAFVLEGARVITLAQDGRAVVRDGTTLAELHVTSPPRDLAPGRCHLSQDGLRAIAVPPLAAAGEPVVVWDVASGELVWTLALDGPVTDAALSPDGLVAVVSTIAGELHVFDLAAGAPPVVFDGGRAIALAVGAGGRTLAWSDMDFGVHVASVATGVSRRLHQGTLPSFGLALSPDGQRLARARFATVEVWDVVSGRRSTPPRGLDGLVAVAEPSPDGRALALAGLDPRLVRVDLAGSGPPSSVELPSPATAVAFSADGRRAYCACQGGALLVLDARSSPWTVETRLDHPGGAMSVSVPGDGARALSVGPTGAIWWDLGAPGQVRTLGWSQGQVVGAALAPVEGAAVLVNPGGEVGVFDLVSGTQTLAVPPVPERALGSYGRVAFGDRGARLLLAATTGALELVELTPTPPSRRALPALGPGVHPAAALLVPGARRAVVAGSDGSLRLYDLEAGHELERLELGAADDKVATLSATASGELFVGTVRGVVFRVSGAR